MVLIILLVFAFAISFVLAWLSLRNFHDLPSDKHSYGLFWIQNPQIISQSFLDDLYQSATRDNLIISFEKLSKGPNTSYLIYAPSDLISRFPQLQLVEVEDYTSKVDINGLQAFEIQPKKRVSFLSNLANLPGHLKLDDEEGFLFQVVSHPQSHQQDNFQITVRAAVFARDAARRVELIKKLTDLLHSNSSLLRSKKTKSTLSLFELYRKRAVRPKQMAKFTVNSEELLKLLSL